MGALKNQMESWCFNIFFPVFYRGKDATAANAGQEELDEGTVDAPSDDETFSRLLSPLVFRHLPDLPSLIHIMMMVSMLAYLIIKLI